MISLKHLESTQYIINYYFPNNATLINTVNYSSPQTFNFAIANVWTCDAVDNLARKMNMLLKACGSDFIFLQLNC